MMAITASERLSTKMSDDFFQKIYAMVREIPLGRVTTYGALAEAAGARSSSRMVGYALNQAAGRPDLPCHRVVNRLGELSGRRHFAGDSMRVMLEQEGITFADEYRINLEKHFWKP